MHPQRETRDYKATQIRAVDAETRTFEALVVVYGVLDDYETIFDAGCFTDSLNDRLPRITWAHQWSEPLGRYVDFRDDDTGLVLIGEFDDFDAVPRARQAYAQLVSGTIDQFSVGFRVHSDRQEDDVLHFVKCTLDEAALVLVGAVPGTKLLAVRSGAGLVREVPEELIVTLAKKKAAGEITEPEIEAALDIAAGQVGAQSAGSGDGGAQQTPAEPDPAAVVEEHQVEEALVTLGLD